MDNQNGDMGEQELLDLAEVVSEMYEGEMTAEKKNDLASSDESKQKVLIEYARRQAKSANFDFEVDLQDYCARLVANDGISVTIKLLQETRDWIKEDVRLNECSVEGETEYKELLGKHRKTLEALKKKKEIFEVLRNSEFEDVRDLINGNVDETISDIVDSGVVRDREELHDILNKLSEGPLSLVADKNGGHIVFQGEKEVSHEAYEVIFHLNSYGLLLGLGKAFGGKDENDREDNRGSILSDHGKAVLALLKPEQEQPEFVPPEVSM
ncbi:MAG: hypothetical protein OEY94_05085 [Alphaproteobacteria bacterium]|nr:hypothetical protein [Alphaproteobacteria bacterium]